jgi:hypothetical protein
MARPPGHDLKTEVVRELGGTLRMKKFSILSEHCVFSKFRGTHRAAGEAQLVCRLGWHPTLPRRVQPAWPTDRIPRPRIDLRCPPTRGADAALLGYPVLCIVGGASEKRGSA